MVVACALFEGNPVVQIILPFGYNSLKILEDTGLALLGFTEGVTDVSECVGQTALSGVCSVSIVVQSGVTGSLAHESLQSHHGHRGTTNSTNGCGRLDLCELRVGSLSRYHFHTQCHHRMGIRQDD